jgi:ABC-2 type transport system permease protein
MNVFVAEIRRNALSLVGWTVGLCLVLIFCLPYLTDFLNVSSASRLLFTSAVAVGERGNLVPEAVYALGSIGVFSYVYGFIILAASVQAVMMGLIIADRETRYATADYLFTKPQSRTWVYVQKFFAGMVCLLIMQGVIYVVCAAGLRVYAPDTVLLNELLLAVLSMGFTQYFCFALGLAIAALYPKYPRMIILAVAVMVAFALIDMIADITQLEVLTWLTPLQYFDVNYAMLYQGFEMGHLTIGLVLMILFALAGWFAFRHRDLLLPG